jgi:hypothetical protein
MTLNRSLDVSTVPKQKSSLQPDRPRTPGLHTRLIEIENQGLKGHPCYGQSTRQLTMAHPFNESAVPTAALGGLD